MCVCVCLFFILISILQLSYQSLLEADLHGSVQLKYHFSEINSVRKQQYFRYLLSKHDMTLAMRLLPSSNIVKLQYLVEI